MRKKRKAISYILTVALLLTTACIPIPVLAATASDPLNQAKVTVTNNAAETKDVIYITSGTKLGDVIQVYSEGRMVFKSAAAKSASFRFEIPSGILDDMADGSISLTVTGLGKEESSPIDVSYIKAPQSLAANIANIIVTNNVNSGSVFDKVNITGLRSGDVFHVYYQNPDGQTELTPIAKSGVATTKGTAEATLKTDLPESGSIWITVKSTGRTESPATEVLINDVDKTVDPIIATGTNNFGANDTIMITGLYPGDQVKAMEESTGVVYGSGTVSKNKTDIEISARANKTGLIASGGSIMVQVTTVGKTTIMAGPFAYDGELVSSPVAIEAQSEFIDNVTYCGSVTIYNYENKMDQIEITGLLPKDKILITDNPADPQKAITLKTGTVADKSTVFRANLKLPQIAEGNETGSILIYVTSVGKSISEAAKVEYSLSNRSTSPTDVTATPDATTTAVAVRAVTNSAFSYGDSIWVTGVQGGDKLMVYALPEAPTNGTKEITLNGKNSGTVGTGKTEIIIQAEFPNKTEGGTIYLSYIRPGMQESTRVAIQYQAEIRTDASNVSVSAFNTAGDKDTLTVTGAPKDALIQAYVMQQDGSYTAIKGGSFKIKIEGQPTVGTFMLPAIPVDAPTGAGVIYVGVTFPGESESELILVNYDAEPRQAWDTDKLTVQAINVFGSGDYVVFSQLVNAANISETADMSGANGLPTIDNLYPGHTLLTPKTVITLYATTDPAVKTKIGSYTIPNKSSLVALESPMFKIERIINAKSLNPAGGTMAYTVTYPGKAESDRVAIPFPSESQTDITLLNVEGGDVIITNNINTGAMPDYINISTGGIVTTGSIIKVYSSDALNSAVLAKVIVTAKMVSESSITIALTGKYVLGAEAGSVWISIQEAGKSESNPIEVQYQPAADNQTPSITPVTTGAGIQVVAINNEGVNVKDFILVFGLEPEDVVTLSYKVSDTAKLTTQTAKVAAKQSTATFSLYIHDAAWAGSGYITVTRKGLLESERLYLNQI